MLNKVHRLPSTLAITGLCRTSLYNQLKEGQFPEPVRIGARAVGWLEADLNDWIASRQKRNASK